MGAWVNAGLGGLGVNPRFDLGGGGGGRGSVGGFGGRRRWVKWSRSGIKVRLRPLGCEWGIMPLNGAEKWVPVGFVVWGFWGG